MKACILKDCKAPLKSGSGRGYCPFHYYRLLRYGNVRAGRSARNERHGQLIGRPPILKACGYCMEIKNKSEFLKKMCVECYRNKRHEARRVIGTPCKVEGCVIPVSVSGRMRLCNAHFYRLKKYGSATAGPSLHKPHSLGPHRHFNRQGYVCLRIQGKARLEHRVVMERILGRPLLPTEYVHHRNGDRADNKPQNLELWSRAQPSGQRVEDKVQWAQELLSLYAPQLLVSQQRETA